MGMDGALTLNAADYDPIEHLNAIFYHPAALSSVAATSEALRSYQDDLDEDITHVVASQSASDADSVQRIQAAKAELADLFMTIESVRERAVQTEQTITEMTADIKRLDSTKKNLTLSMTALKRLQMLTTIPRMRPAPAGRDTACGALQELPLDRSDCDAESQRSRSAE
jgi:septal ring factor EnvC (AmiA/AmiB activator)